MYREKQFETTTTLVEVNNPNNPEIVKLQDIFRETVHDILWDKTPFIDIPKTYWILKIDDILN